MNKKFLTLTCCIMALCSTTFASEYTYGSGDDEPTYGSAYEKEHQTSHSENTKQNKPNEDNSEENKKDTENAEDTEETKKQEFTSKPYFKSLEYETVYSTKNNKRYRARKLKKIIQGYPKEIDGKKGDYVVITKEYVASWSTVGTLRQPIVKTRKTEHFYPYDKDGKPTVNYDSLAYSG